MRVGNNMTQNLELTKEQQQEANKDYLAKLQRIENNKSWIVVATEIQDDRNELVKHSTYPKSVGTKKDGTLKLILDETTKKPIMIPSHKVDMQKLTDKLNEAFKAGECEFEFKFHYQAGLFLEMNDRPNK